MLNQPLLAKGTKRETSVDFYDKLIKIFQNIHHFWRDQEKLETLEILTNYCANSDIICDPEDPRQPQLKEINKKLKKYFRIKNRVNDCFDSKDTSDSQKTTFIKTAVELTLANETMFTCTNKDETLLSSDKENDPLQEIKEVEYIIQNSINKQRLRVAKSFS
jgi:hypothetical protein